MEILKPSTESKLDSLAHEAGSEPGEGGFMNPKKKKGGRPPGAKNKNPSAQPDCPASPSPSGHIPDPIMQSQQRIEANRQFIAGGMSFLDDALFPLHETPSARLKPDQRDLIVINGAICMEQYLPDLLNRHMPLILVSFGLGGYGFGIYNARKIKLAEMNERARRQQAMNGVKPIQAVDPISGAPLQAN